MVKGRSRGPAKAEFLVRFQVEALWPNPKRQRDPTVTRRCVGSTPTNHPPPMQKHRQPALLAAPARASLLLPSCRNLTDGVGGQSCDWVTSATASSMSFLRGNASQLRSARSCAGGRRRLVSRVGGNDLGREGTRKRRRGPARLPTPAHWRSTPTAQQRPSPSRPSVAPTNRRAHPGHLHHPGIRSGCSHRGDETGPSTICSKNLTSS
jgi:hypothetical protein